MVSPGALALAGLAVWCWPPPGRVIGALRAGPRDGGSGRGRVGRDRVGRERRGDRLSPAVRGLISGRRAGRRVVLGTAAIGGLLGAVSAGPPSGAAMAMVVATVAVLVLRALRRRETRRGLGDLSSGLRLLARELAAGASAASAVAAVADTGGRCAEFFAGLAVELGSGGPVRGMPGGGDPLPGTAGISGLDEGGEVAGIAARLRAIWMMSLQYGIPLAVTVRALSDDVSERRAAMDRRATQTAGPTLSGYLLAGLPVAGLALGGAMGAEPIRILTTTALGGLLLVVGTALTCAGLLWSARLAGGRG